MASLSDSRARLSEELMQILKQFINHGAAAAVLK